MFPRVILGLAVVLLVSARCVSGSSDDAVRLVRDFRSSKNAITGLDDGVAALKTKPQIFDDLVPRASITDDAVENLLAKTRSRQEAVLTRWADDTASALASEGEDASTVTREVVKGVACDVMAYYIDEGELPPVEMLAAFLVSSFGDQFFQSPSNVAEDIIAMVASMQSGQSAISWLALQSAGCGSF